MGVETILVDEVGRRTLDMGGCGWVWEAAPGSPDNVRQAAWRAWEKAQHCRKPWRYQPSPETIEAVAQWCGESDWFCSVDPGSRWGGEDEPWDAADWGEHLELRDLLGKDR